MKSRTIEKMQYFVGKVCSVFTGPLCRSFDEIRAREHFVVRVQEVDVDGLWGTHPYNDTVSYFPQESIKLITEEVLLDPSNPEHARMIKDYQEKTGKTIISDVSPHLAPVVEMESKTPVSNSFVEKQEPAFVDIKHLSNLAQRTKRSFDSMV